MKPAVSLVARLSMAFIFVMAGFGKIGGYVGTLAYMESMGIPGALLPLVILTELGGGLLLAIGWQTRWAAGALAGFTLLSAIVFHRHFADPMQMMQFMKNLAISGGLLLLVLHGPGSLSLDKR